MDVQTVSGASVRPAKTSKLDWSSCLCHVRDVSGPLTSFTERNWQTFCRAAEIHRDKTYIFLRVNGADAREPRGGLHRECYQSYMNKKSLEHALAKRKEASESAHCETEDNSDDESDSDDEEATSTHDHSSTTPRLTRSKVTPTSSSVCLFCRKVTKRHRGTRYRLMQCLTFEACEAIYNAAQIQNDGDVLRELLPGPGQPDPIARELRYHRPCYAKYTHAKTLEKLLEDEQKAERGTQPLRDGMTVYDRAFLCLAAEVNENIITKAAAGNVARVADLCSRYNTFLLEEEGVGAANYRVANLKKRLRKHFGNALVFFRNNKRVTDPELVTAGNIPKEVLLARLAESTPRPYSAGSAGSDNEGEPMSPMELADCADALVLKV